MPNAVVNSEPFLARMIESMLPTNDASYQWRTFSIPKKATAYEVNGHPVPLQCAPFDLRVGDAP